MPQLIHFQFTADDPNRAASFYSDVFGWTFHKVEGKDYWVIDTGREKPGIDGSMTRRVPEIQGTVNAIGVTSIDDYLARIQQKGGTVVVEKRGITGIGQFAYCKDPEGNTFSVIQPEGRSKELSSEELEAVFSSGYVEAMHLSKW